MEQIPSSQSHEAHTILADLEEYRRECANAQGELGETLLAVTEFIRKQFAFDFNEAMRIVHNSRMFNARDSAQTTYEKAAIAPLQLMDMYVEAMAGETPEQEGDPLWTDTLADWYSMMATMTQGIASKTWHSTRECCTDDFVAKDTVCAMSSTCSLRVLRQLLLRPALRTDLAFLGTYADEIKHHGIVDAKLSAAVDCELITSDQKMLLDAAYLARVAAQREEQ